MKNYKTSRIPSQSKIFEYYLSIQKIKGNKLNSKTERDNLNFKYEYLSQYIRSNHHKHVFNLQRITNIFNNIKEKEEIKNNNISKITNPKFVEKYKELYNITTNNNYQNSKREKSNSVNYFFNKLKTINNINKEKSKNINFYINNFKLKQNFNNNMPNEILNKTYTINSNRRNNNQRPNLGNYFYNNKIDAVKTAIKSINKIKIDRHDNTTFNNNFNKNDKNNYKNYYIFNKIDRIKSSFPFNYNKGNIYEKKSKISFIKENEIINQKLQDFKTKLDLVAMK